MRINLLWVFAAAAGCHGLPGEKGPIAAGLRGPDLPPRVVRTDSEFDRFLAAARSELSADGLATRLEAARPDFDRQALILVRHDAASDSEFTFDTGRGRKGGWACRIRTERRGHNRDLVPFWFAAAVDRPAPMKVQVYVDGKPRGDIERGVARLGRRE